MTLLRPLHLLLALVLPALAGIGLGLVLKLLGKSQGQIVLGMARTVGLLGPALAGIKLHCDQPQRLQQHSPAIILFNHQSGLDPVIVAAQIRHPVVGVAKHSLARNPLLGPLLRLAGTLFIRRGEGWQEQLLPHAEKRIKQGFSIIIAPEGTRVENEPRSPIAQHRSPGRFRLGAFAIARASGLPMIPLVIHNSGDRLPPRSWQLRTGPVYVSVLEPVYIDPNSDLQQAAQEMETRYAQCLAQGYRQPDYSA